MVRYLNLIKLRKKITINWSRDRPRPLSFENCNQRFPPLAKRAAPVFLYKKIDPTKCLRNQLGMVRNVTIGWCSWFSLTSVSPKIKLEDFLVMLGLKLLLVFSVTPFKIDQNENQNGPIDKVQNLGNERK